MDIATIFIQRSPKARPARVLKFFICHASPLPVTAMLQSQAFQRFSAYAVGQPAIGYAWATMSTPLEIAALSLIGLYATYHNAPNWAVCAFAAAMAQGWRLLSH